MADSAMAQLQTELFEQRLADILTERRKGELYDYLEKRAEKKYGHRTLPRREGEYPGAKAANCSRDEIVSEAWLSILTSGDIDFSKYDAWQCEPTVDRHLAAAFHNASSKYGSGWKAGQFKSDRNSVQTRKKGEEELAGYLKHEHAAANEQRGGRKVKTETHAKKSEAGKKPHTLGSMYEKTLNTKGGKVKVRGKDGKAARYRTTTTVAHYQQALDAGRLDELIRGDAQIIRDCNAADRKKERRATQRREQRAKKKRDAEREALAAERLEDSMQELEDLLGKKR
jgi:hypothetical protein